MKTGQSAMAVKLMHHLNLYYLTDNMIRAYGSAFQVADVS